MLVFRLVGRVGGRDMGSLRYLLDVQFSLVSKTSLFATCEKLLDDFILPPKNGQLFHWKFLCKMSWLRSCWHIFHQMELYHSIHSPSYHPIDPIDPGCRGGGKFHRGSSKGYRWHHVDVVDTDFWGQQKEIPWVALPTTNLAICWTVSVGQPLILRYT